MVDLKDLLDIAVRDHDHLCPRQVLGVRSGLRGMSALGFFEPPAKKRLMVITETDGCYADGLSAATGCSVGHRTLRVEDYGKVAAVFVDMDTGQAIRVSPVLDIRQKACFYLPGEPRHYLAQLQAYQVMPDDEMFNVEEVALSTPLAAIISRAGVRVNCDLCGEEIINEREIVQDGMTLCRSCACGGYYQTRTAGTDALFSPQRSALTTAASKS